MGAKPVIAIFDAGKTNKKLFLFDEQYNIVFERTARFNEITDEDGFPCENVEALKISVLDALHEVAGMAEFNVKAINFSGYGASFVYLDRGGETFCPLYNYLKPYPEKLQEQFYHTYGGEIQFSLQTASPVLGNLNSGMQLYRLKHQKIELFDEIKYALHLPQYLSYVVTHEPVADITSVGCHTNMWDFTRNNYHNWIEAEGLTDKLPPIVSATSIFKAVAGIPGCATGIGLHDSSAALIPYLFSFKEPFMLLSTGTWCISLNPFNQQALIEQELAQDCLNFIQYNGKMVRASRLFTGYEHEQGVKRIAAYFNESPAKFKHISYDKNLADLLPRYEAGSNFEHSDLAQFSNSEQAYHALIQNLVHRQYQSSMLVIKDTNISTLFVDGGFSKNDVFMNMLAGLFPHLEVYAASMAQASALGAALVIHDSWNSRPVPEGIVSLKRYKARPQVQQE